MRLNHSMLATLLIGALACGALTGCGGPKATDEAYIFAFSGPTAVDVSSFNGDVEILVDSRGGDEISVEVTRHAMFGKGRNDDAKAALNTIAWTANVDQSTTPATVRVTTNTTHPEPHFLRAHVVVRVPAAMGVTVRTSRGEVYAKNVRGPIDIQSTEGDVRVMTNWAITEPVTIITSEADIDYRVRGDSTAAIDAETINGKALARVRYGRFILRNPKPGKMIATLNRGSNPVVLRTTDGDIRIAVVHNPTEVGPMVVDP